MLNENIVTLRKSKGLSQEELAVKLNVVRQTVSKWEKGLSVPDADMLISISEVFDTPVSVLLGEKIAEEEINLINTISEKLEVINLQLAKNKELKRKKLHLLFISLSAVIVIITVCLFFLQSPYLSWDYSDPETAVVGTVLHAFEFFFVRIAPFAFIGTIFGIIMTRRKVN